jgi:vitamin B12 transporter
MSGGQFACAQNANSVDDEIIVTAAALRAVSAKDVTSSVTVISQEDLAIRGSSYIADQLRAVPGVGVSRAGALGGLTQIRLRGAEANHTLVLVNGMEVSDPTTGETDFGVWAGAGLERIEVARGEQSVLYGSDAIGGVISLKTGGEGLSGAAEYGSFDTFRGDLGYFGQNGATTYGITASAFETDGVDSAGQGGETDGSDALSISAMGEHELQNGWSFGGYASFRNSSQQSDPDLNFDGALDNADRENDVDQLLLSGRASGQTGTLDHIARISFSDIRTRNFSDGEFANATTGERFKLSYSPSASFPAAGGALTLSAIAEYEDENYEREDTNTLFGDPNQSQSFQTFGLGAELRARLENLALNASVRRDDNDGRFENATTWRAGAAYNFGAGSKLRASTGKGVKNPTFTELFGFFPGSFVGNPDLVPENSTSWEIGFDQGIGPLSASVSYFDAQLENEIFTAFNPDFTSTAANRSENSKRSGIELGARLKLAEGLDILGAVSKISSKNETGEDEIRVPEWTASLAFNWASQRLDGFRVGGALDYVGAQDDFNFGTFPAQRVTLDSYILASASAEYPVSSNFSLTLRGENLFDERAVDVLGFNGPGAGVFIGFKLR